MVDQMEDEFDMVEDESAATDTTNGSLDSFDEICARRIDTISYVLLPHQ